MHSISQRQRLRAHPFFKFLTRSGQSSDRGPAQDGDDARQKMASTTKTSPVIVITGTPGTGKSTHAELLVQESPVALQHINVSEFVKEKELYENFDDGWDTYIVDEDKLIDELEPLASAGGVILDWHACEPWPERWVDLVVVLRCNHTKLWERLEERQYPLKKIKENNEAEIMEVIAQEARDSYVPEIVVELKSESIDDLESNVARIVEWIRTWRKDRDHEPES